MIATIRGMLEIEQIEADRALEEQLVEQVKTSRELHEDMVKQTKRSRKLQKTLLKLEKKIKKSSDRESKDSRNLNITIGVVGGGMAAASVIATSYALIEEQPILMPWDAQATTVHPFVKSVVLSLGWGLVLAIILLVLLLPKRTD